MFEGNVIVTLFSEPFSVFFGSHSFPYQSLLLCTSVPSDKVVTTHVLCLSNILSLVMSKYQCCTANSFSVARLRTLQEKKYISFVCIHMTIKIMHI